MPRRIILKNNGLAGSLPNGVKGFGIDSLGRPSLLVDSSIIPITDGNTFYLALNFIDLEEFVYVAPENFKIISVTNPSAISYTITVNDIPYTLDNSINEFDVVKVNVLSVGFLKLNCEVI